MGYHDYSELSYVRMNRIGYGPEEIRKFRDQVANDVVPQLQKVMALRAKRTGFGGIIARRRAYHGKRVYLSSSW